MSLLARFQVSMSMAMISDTLVNRHADRLTYSPLLSGC